MIKIKKLNETFIRIETDDYGLHFEIQDIFSYFVPGYRFMPKFKMGVWDGKIKLYNTNTHTLYAGLLNDLIDELEKKNYAYELDDSLMKKTTSVSVKDIVNAVNLLDLKNELWEHQLQAVTTALLKERCIIISPTGSGKSLIIYCIIQYFLKTILENEKILIVVPIISLVNQMANDFVDYDVNEKISEKIHGISGGIEKESSKQIYISTWQSIFKQPREYFEQFECVIIDEVHTAKADSIKGILEKCVNAKYRFGLTGTLDEWKTHHMVLTGLLGKIYKISSTNELIDKKIITPLKIYNMILKYDMIDCMNTINFQYHEEVEFILTHTKRNRFIIDEIIPKLKNNTLIIFTRIKHGKWIFEEIQKKTDKKTLYIDGHEKVKVRENIRKIMETADDYILVANAQCFSTGINIKNIHNVVLVAGGKSKIRTLQSIGRGLRLNPNKTLLNVIDVVDDLRCEYVNEKTGRINTHNNHFWKHYINRLRYYNNEKFKSVEKNYNLGG